MTATALTEIAGIVDKTRAAFDSGRTRPLKWRIDTLRKLRTLLVEGGDGLLDALRADFGKPPIEAWASEIGFCISEIDHTLAHLPNWVRPERVATPVAGQPGSSRIVSEPLGVVAVIAPWNYPLQLLIVPAIQAISAGNAVVAKPSELTPAAEEALAAMLHALDEPAVSVVRGGVAETTELLEQRFDHIVYTGNSRVARIVMKAAAAHLTPVTLELGGKSPAIVSRNANIAVAAKRIAWGKFLNAGQTCIAPDYVLVERQVHDRLVDGIVGAIRDFYGADPQQSPDYARLVTGAHFNRVAKFLDDGTVACGGKTDADDRYIAPTVLTGVSRADSVMQDEIFGPVLPVLAVDSLDEAVRFVNADHKPLALYVFSEKDEESDQVIGATSSGGVCINATLFHVTNPNLPFGGVGESGMGAYHGKSGFDALSHRRAVYSRSTRIDPPLLYPPYTAQKEKLVRTGLGLPDPRDLASSLVNKVRRRG